MKLLESIQKDTISNDCEIAVLLRKCLILANKMGNKEFEKWVKNEMSGYKNIDELPEYRIINTYSKGHFTDHITGIFKNLEIPVGSIPKKYRSFIEFSKFTQSVAEIEDLVKKSTEGYVRHSWAPDLTAAVGDSIYNGMKCLQAWKTISTSRLTGIINEIRNRILIFILELDNEIEFNEDNITMDDNENKKVEKIVQTIIYGNVGNLAPGSTDFKQEIKKFETQNELFDKLIELVKQNDSESHQELIEAIHEMKNTYGTNDFQNKYNYFMSFIANHLQVYGTLLGPYLGAVEKLLT